MAQNKNIKNYLDRLVGEEGMRTDVNITMTTQTMITLAVGLVTAGVCIVVVANIMKNVIKNHQSEEIKVRLETIIQNLKQLK
ncbi:hypothetical protein JMN32_00090 [Fulvivirga sp. 29W222]|uniref:Uncharacterized protein n=1 Tax=Fulvivirga marina TaxID=2494733 RepID=A0A937FXD7_9BACT|nr:hypothetical protein [Fulvivirga marina]MBL6444686.1 hypothetical protein [Fulvivirga marina]